MIKVRMVYRNYKPLHSMFSTYAECPPDGVVLDIPPAKKQTKLLSKLQAVQRRFADNSLMKWVLTQVVDPFFFGSSAADTSDADLIHFLNMMPARPTDKPYIIEFENVGMLFGYGNKDQQQKARQALLSESCKAIICSSQASKRTLQELLDADYDKVEKKVHVVYPAICSKYVAPIKKNFNGKKVNLLFVGNLCYLKGLEEVFMALEAEPELKGRLSLDIISNDAKELIDKHPDLADIVSYFQPTFSKKEILEKFYSKADALLMPTKRDTFGFAIVDAIASGLPVISTRQFAIPELIDDGKDGILMDLTNPTLEKTIYLPKKDIEADMVSNPDLKLASELRSTLTSLVGGKYDLNKMSKACLTKVRAGGKFSASRRNKQLSEIYENAVF